ncbi:hypothetical protein HDU78_006772 [Chytriomyces hyalinus]|nr:hypothetical protein HDU78_006772 [Chytriomyces hyalinus]
MPAEAHQLSTPTSTHSIPKMHRIRYLDNTATVVPEIAPAAEPSASTRHSQSNLSPVSSATWPMVHSVFSSPVYLAAPSLQPVYSRVRAYSGNATIACPCFQCQIQAQQFCHSENYVSYALVPNMSPYYPVSVPPTAYSENKSAPTRSATPSEHLTPEDSRSLIACMVQELERDCVIDSKAAKATAPPPQTTPPRISHAVPTPAPSPLDPVRGYQIDKVRALLASADLLGQGGQVRSDVDGTKRNVQIPQLISKLLVAKEEAAVSGFKRKREAFDDGIRVPPNSPKRAF